MAKRLAKKAASAVKKSVRGVKKTIARATGAAKKSAGSGKTKAATTATSRGSKPVGDVIGVSQARVPAKTPRATKDRGGNPKGIEIGPQAKGPGLLKPSRTRF